MSNRSRTRSSSYEWRREISRGVSGAMRRTRSSSGRSRSGSGKSRCGRSRAMVARVET